MKILLKKEKLLLILLLIISLPLFFYRIGEPTLFETDEVIYSQIAREIVKSGNWVTLHLFSKEWFIHPPLYMWMVAAGSFIFGDNEFNTRLPNALFAVGLLYITYLLGKKMYGNGVGILAAFILAFSLQYILQARMAIFDIPYIFFMLSGVLSFLYWLQDKLKRYYYLAFACMGMAVLMKGPVGIVIPLLAISIFLAVKSDIRRLVNIHLVPGLLFAFMFGGTWYLAESMIHGKLFVDSVLGFYTVGRFLRPIEAHYAPWYFYIAIILFGFIPWTPFLIFSIPYQWNRRSDGNNLFVVMWLAIVFLFFTFAKTKLPGYIMSFYPFAAISVAKMFSDHYLRENPEVKFLITKAYKTLAIFSVILVVIGVSFKVIDIPEGMDRIFSNLNVTFLILGSGGFISYIFLNKKRDPFQPLAILLATMLIFAVYTASSTMITLDDFKPMKALSSRISSEYSSGDIIVGYNVLNRGSFQHYLDKPVIWISDIFSLRGMSKQPERIILITNVKDISLVKSEFGSLFLLEKHGDMVLFLNKK